MTALEHGMHWPAAEQQLDSAEDPDADDVFMVDVFMEMQATTIQAAFRDRLARRQAAAAPFPLPPQSLQPASSSSRPLSGSRSTAFLIFTAITLFATVKMLGTAAAPAVPTLPYTALTRAIENDEVRALGLDKDLFDSTVWHALALLHDRGQTRFAVSVPTRSVASLLDLVRSHGVDFASSQAALPPPSSTPPPALLAYWLAPPSVAPLSPALALALPPSSILPQRRSRAPQEPPRGRETVFDLLFCLLLAYAVVYVVHLVVKHLFSDAVPALVASPTTPPPTPPAATSAPSTTPTPATSVPTVQAAAPQLSGLTLKSPMKDFRAYVDAHTSPRVKAVKLGTGNRRKREHILRDLYAAEGIKNEDVADTARRLFRDEDEKLKREQSPLTWNELQRRMGGRGFTTAQMSLMWEAHKKGHITYPQFRKHCAGHGLNRAVESRLWEQHTLLAAEGVWVLPQAHA